MSVFILRNDDICEMYNRTIFICYTRMSKKQLVKYVKDLELLAEDRQSLFFKTDVDIMSPPVSLDLKHWIILTVILKAEVKPSSFGVLIKLFYEVFPHKTLVDYSTQSVFICSGNFDGGELGGDDFKSFQKLSEYHKRAQRNVKEISEEFRSRSRDSADAINMIIGLAKRYEIYGGHWIMFFNRLDVSRWEEVFDVLISGVYKKHIWKVINRFNAKISRDKLIICYGNERTRASEDPSLIQSQEYPTPSSSAEPAPAQFERAEKNDPQVYEVIKVIDGIYDPQIFGSMACRYKTDIMSACCIQRKNVVRPTVYQNYYGYYSNSFRPLPKLDDDRENV